MSNPSATTAPKPTSTLRRYLLVLLLGFIAGLIATVMGLRAIQARIDPFPNALMQVMARQQHLLSENHKQNRCTVSDALPRLQSLRALANDMESAFPGLSDDARFQQHASAFRANLDAALASVPDNCVAFEAVVQRSGESCKHCHQDFR